MEKYQTQLKIWQNKPFIKQLVREFPKAEIFLVGGMVRDAMLGRQVKDADFVVRNVAKADLEKFLAKGGKVSLVGKRFGVFKFTPRRYAGGEIDIALPRTEHSIDQSGAYKDFKIKSNASLKIEDDLSRRDFTINAMAFNLKTGQLIDPFKGLADIKSKKIKTVGAAQDRFQEDYSRMLRAIRFACQLDFKIEAKTWTVTKKLAKNLTRKVDGKQIVPNEVIAKELVKALTANPVAAVELLDRAELIKVLAPELLKMKRCPQPKQWHTEGDVWVHTVLALKNLSSKKFKAEFNNTPVTAELVFGLLFHDLGKPYTITKTDRIRFHGHDVVSAEKFGVIAERLRLSAAGLDVELIKKIIAKHMILANPVLKQMKNTTVEKYFFSPIFPGQELLQLMFCDILATIPATGKSNFTNYNILKNKIKKLNKGRKNQTILSAPLVNGHDIIKQLKIKPSAKIGELLNLAREAQLKGKIKNKTQALNLLKTKL